MICHFRNSYPSIIVRKIGIVAFRQNIKLLIKQNSNLCSFFMTACSRKPAAHRLQKRGISRPMYTIPCPFAFFQCISAIAFQTSLRIAPSSIFILHFAPRSPYAINPIAMLLLCTQFQKFFTKIVNYTCFSIIRIVVKGYKILGGDFYFYLQSYCYNQADHGLSVRFPRRYFFP